MERFRFPIKSLLAISLAPSLPAVPTQRESV